MTEEKTLFEKYLTLDHQLTRIRNEAGDDEHPDEGALLEQMDPLWWELSEDARKVAEYSRQGCWVLLDGIRYCPYCGHQTKNGGPSVRCMVCMRDVSPVLVSAGE